jgi:uncharacterized repeat protein (TIGR01451 family)
VEDETYDLYLYDSKFDLIDSTHPFTAPDSGVTEPNATREPSTKDSPQVLSLTAPAGGRYYVAVNRAAIGGTTTGDFGAFVLTLDEAATADVSITQTDSPDPVKKDKPLTYTLTVGNAGPSAASGVTMTDPLPSGVALKSAKTTQGTCTSAKASGVVTVTCSLGSLAAGSSATVTVVANHLTVGTLTNVVSVTAQSDDPNLANNSAPESTTVKR